MPREHQIYWLSTEESGEDGVGRNWYYLKDARKQAQQLANELNTEVYINQGENIVDVMYPDIFRTLKHYSAGFHRSNPPEINKIYDEKVREVAGRIYADLEHAPEIIAEEFAKCEVLKWRRAFTEGRVPTDTYTAVWKAIDNISMALVDTTPLKNK